MIEPGSIAMTSPGRAESSAASNARAAASPVPETGMMRPVDCALFVSTKIAGCAGIRPLVESEDCAVRACNAFSHAAREELPIQTAAYAAKSPITKVRNARLDHRSAQDFIQFFAFLFLPLNHIEFFTNKPPDSSSGYPAQPAAEPNR